MVIPSCMFVQPGCSGCGLPIAQCRCSAFFIFVIIIIMIVIVIINIFIITVIVITISPPSSMNMYHLYGDIHCHLGVNSERLGSILLLLAMST